MKNSERAVDQIVSKDQLLLKEGLSSAVAKLALEKETIEILPVNEYYRPVSHGWQWWLMSAQKSGEI